MTFGAYIHARPNGEVFYVGKGKTRRAYNLHRPRNPYHGNIVSKYGKENILVGFIPCSTEETAFELEIGLIKTFTRNNIKLTNRTTGGEGVSGLIHSMETRAKLSAASKGVVFSDETRAKLSASHKGAIFTDEHRSNLSVAAKGRIFTKEHRDKLSMARKRRMTTNETRQKISSSLKGNQRCAGRILTEEHKAKIRAANKGKVHTIESKARMSNSRIAYLAKRDASKDLPNQ